MNNEYYSGASAIADYLRPLPDRYIPLVELPPALNPFLEKYDIHIDAKLMNTLPLGNVKSLPAWQMLEDAGDLRNAELVEASSGNTVMSLGLLAPHFGARGVTAIASPEVSKGKLALLQLAGVKVKLVEGPICPDPKDPDGAIAVARRAGTEPDKRNLGQYDNEANPRAHERITGPQLFIQLGDRIGMFVAGLGTTGTLLGTARFLKQKLPGVKIAGIVRTPNNPVPGVRTVNGLREVAFSWNEIITEPLLDVNEKDSYKASLKLIRQGLLVGPSAGFAYEGALRHLARLEKSGEIEALRGKHVVLVCPDTPFPYALDYEKVLGSEYFPATENAQLRDDIHTAYMPRTTQVPELTAETLFAMYSPASEAADMRAADAVLIDVREPDEYEDHHLPGGENVPLATLPSWLKRWPDGDTRQVVFVCRSGNRSARAAYLAKQMGVNAYNLTGGTAEWSARDYPRVRFYCPPV